MKAAEIIRFLGRLPNQQLGGSHHHPVLAEASDEKPLRSLRQTIFFPRIVWKMGSDKNPANMGIGGLKLVAT